MSVSSSLFFFFFLPLSLLLLYLFLPLIKKKKNYYHVGRLLVPPLPSLLAAGKPSTRCRAWGEEDAQPGHVI